MEMLVTQIKELQILTLVLENEVLILHHIHQKVLIIKYPYIL